MEVRVNITVRLKDPKDALDFMNLPKKYTEANIPNGVTIGYISSLYVLDNYMTDEEIVTFALENNYDDLESYKKHGAIETLVDINRL